MLRHLADTGRDVPATLLVSSRSWDDVIYRAELEGLDGENIRIVHTLTREQPEGWNGYARRVDAELLGDDAPHEIGIAARGLIGIDRHARGGDRRHREGRPPRGNRRRYRRCPRASQCRARPRCPGGAAARAASLPAATDRGPPGGRHEKDAGGGNFYDKVYEAPRPELYDLATQPGVTFVALDVSEIVRGKKSTQRTL
jgi:hypothetical protein